MEELDFTLPNERLKLRRDPRIQWRSARELVEAGLPAPQAYMAIRDRSDDDLKSYDLAASMLLLDGAFNVNSTSVHAWSALLGSFFGAKVKGKDGVQPGDEYESPFLRINEPLGSAIKEGDNVNSASEEAYLGYRSLSQSEIRTLASEIVIQVKRRGPFAPLPSSLTAPCRKMLHRHHPTGKAMPCKAPSPPPLRMPASTSGFRMK